MGTPSKEELNQALKCAIDMRERGEDPNFIAKSLLNHHYRLKKTEHVIDVVKLYLRTGCATTEHAKMIKALEAYDGIDHEAADYSDFGLD